MWIGYLEIEVYLAGVGSLKEKRMIVKSIKDRVRSRYNVVIAEADGMDKWQRTLLGVVSLSNDKAKLNSLIDRIIDWFREIRAIEVVDYSYRFLNE